MANQNELREPFGTVRMNLDKFRVGPTQELSLRVSVATLVRVLFENPGDGELMLALERKATLHTTESGRTVRVKAQPFGGAVRILDPGALRELIGDFHFDTGRSSAEQDLRIFIRPRDWASVREACIQHLSHADDPVLETGPERELAEEFADALGINLRPDQYLHKPVAMVIEDEPAPAEAISAKGALTARVYRIFEATISDPSLAEALMRNSEDVSDGKLQKLALEDAQNGGRGRANAVLTLPLQPVREAYLAMTPHQRNTPMLFETHRLDETVAAVLEGISVPRYRMV
jgi:hypothetical protein